MKDKSLVNLFELYDQAFDNACHELGITNIPDWHERWFYRYMLINPVFKYAPIIHERCHLHPKMKPIDIEIFFQKLYQSGDLAIDEKYSNILKGSYSSFISEILNPYLYNNFSCWWFYAGKNKIRNDPKVMHIPLFDYTQNWFKKDGTKSSPLERWSAANSKELEDIFYSIETHNIVLLPKWGPKKEILKQVNSILNENHHEKLHIVQNKISERTVKDCYRILEYQIYYGRKNLLQIAEQTNILKISKASLNSQHGNDSSNSVKVGVHRLSKLAMEMITETSFGTFPVFNKPHHSYGKGVYEVLNDYFKLVTKGTLDRIQSKLPPVENMEKLIKSDLKKLGKLVYED
jgi:hypothetical protein